MPTSAPAISPGGCRSSGSEDESAVRYPPPYDVTRCIHYSAAYFDTTHFSRLPNVWTVLVFLFEPGVRSTAVRARQKR